MLFRSGHLEQIGTPEEIYNYPATEHVATFLGAANVLPGVIRNGQVEIGGRSVPAHSVAQGFSEGQAVKLIFRPEDVSLSKTDNLPARHVRLAKGIVEEINFVGAYERVSVRPDFAGERADEANDNSFYLTTETPENSTEKAIVASRAKPEATALRLRFGDRVVIGLASFTILAA